MNWKQINKKQYINLDHAYSIEINGSHKEYIVEFKFSKNNVYFSELFRTLKKAESFLDDILERK